MQVLEAKQDLFRNDLDQGDRDAGLVIPFNEGKEIFTERLKHETDMDILGCAVVERIEKRNDVVVAWMRRVGFLHSAEEFDLVSGGFCVSACGLDHFQSRVLACSVEG